MKITLNIIISVLVFLIYLDVDFNSTAKEVDYSNTFIWLSALLVICFLRYYHREFKELLMYKK